ncbi:hypothetical protein B0H17DRAFT_8277 [Mycena rosella]|uniref:Uncharacterized protein n=1 Tax=Mycena rosella TaxID=1033263 RepID=A0AAD7GSG0_MYCRO|nr:hypothetical protein B0H17DRAFT_8277 [Mycena rosella]
MVSWPSLQRPNCRGVRSPSAPLSGLRWRSSLRKILSRYPDVDCLHLDLMAHYSERNPPWRAFSGLEPIPQSQAPTS